MASDALLLVGLGNPGADYAGNRHNAGAMIVDIVAERLGVRFTSHKAGASVAEGREPGAPHRLIIAKPRSYMNVSGRPVGALVRFYKLEPESVIVVHDDLDLPFGTIRLKQGGGEGGHNGLRSISAALGSKNYLRVRFGIGRPPGRMDVADFVLHNFAAAERDELAVALQDAADAALLVTKVGLAAAQNQVHRGQPH